MFMEGFALHAEELGFPFKSRDMHVFIYQLKALYLPETLVSCITNGYQSPLHGE